MVKIAVGYLAIVVVCAVLILLDPLDFMGNVKPGAEVASTPTTSQDGSDLNNLAAAVAKSLGSAETAADAPPAVALDGAAEDAVAATTAAILADLTSATAAPEEVAAIAPLAVVAAERTLAEMSQAVLEGVKEGTPQEDAGALAGLVTRALIDGETDEAIDALVNEAVAEGTLDVPGALRTTEGKVDTAVLLATIVAQAEGDEFGQGDASEPTEVIEGGTLGLQAASEDVIYTVQPGDSLGALALRFYGDAGLNLAIFKANRQVLDTPESLRYGMKLLIPAKSSL